MPATASALVAETSVAFETVEMADEEDAAEPGIVRVKRFEVQPMGPEEAVDQLELLGHDFYVFLNADTDAINVLYRRRDESYGLLQPELG